MNKPELLETQLCHHQAAKNTTANQDLSRIPTCTDHNFSRLQLKEYLADPANVPYCCPGSSTKALLLPSTPAQTTIFPQSLPRISKEPRELHRCSCTGHPKYEQNRTFRDTPLSPPGSTKNDRKPGFVSNPHPHRPQFFQTHFKEYPGNLQNTQVLLYSASKKLTKQNFYGHTFVTTRQQKTSPQTRSCLESLPGIAKHTSCPPVQSIERTLPKCPVVHVRGNIY